MVLDLGCGQLASRHMTSLYKSLFPGHLQAGQSGMSKMLGNRPLSLSHPQWPMS